ncbi:thioredoxin-2-like [Aphis gossypii]|uniref:thioredoxin-2-like n=1 Tax=Aphis gossypii TaxID=80765 RepID=UPI002159B072|nr:thioredoxin-2-like [Aphis gossypii]
MVQLITKAADLATTLSNAGDNLVIIDFFSNWCGSCKSMDPCINKLAKEYPHVVMLKFDVSVNEEPNKYLMTNEYNIKFMPTFVFLRSKFWRQSCKFMRMAC